MKLPAKLKPELAVISIIIAFFILFFWPATFAGRYFVTGDAIVYSYPLRTIAWDAIRHGSLPLWTPTLLGGYPLLSMAQLGLGYPLTWGYLFLPGYVAEQVYVLAPFLLSPIFTYAFARTLGRSRLAALLAGLSFSYGGMMAGGMAHNGLFTNAVMWLPLMLIAIERARSRPFLPCLIGASAAYAMSVLTGLGQGFVYAGVVALLYAAFLSVAPADDERGWRRLADWRSWKPLVVCVGGTALAAGVAAFQIFETMQAQRLNIRRELSYEIFSGGSFTAAEAPRVWPTPRAEAVSAEEALRRVRGEGGEGETVFNPRETALLEIAPEELRQLSGGEFKDGAGARIVSYEPDRLVIETDADRPSVLVVSEINYPGWMATVDGQRAIIYAANYLLRGLLLPAGTHRVEMRYTAPAARAGALISAFTLLFVIAVFVKARIWS